ncbi:hypothetical protein F5887DRAFT_91833 [Amanita rubescens]|nr:hypothetical protein F5887DRAFT_91833 [Amanita rubescens]
MAKRPTTPLSHSALPAIRQKREIADPTGQSLATIRDGLTDLQHKDFDRQILQILENYPKNDWSSFTLYAIFLTSIFSNGTLPPIKIEDAPLLVRENRDLEKHVGEAMESGSFRKIREILQCRKGPSQYPQPPEMNRSEQLSEDIVTAFDQDYRGMAVRGFLEYLRDNEKKYREANYYGKFCSIVQTSGMGKSRLLCELRKNDVIVLYMNLRAPGDKHAFPPPDAFPAEILTRNFTDEGTYTRKCHAFFIAIFKCLEQRLSASSRENFIKEWNAGMTELVDPICVATRHFFFCDVQKEYDNIYPQISDINGVMVMWKAYASLYKMLAEREKPHGPFLVIAVDEAHELTLTQSPGNWRPSIIFCRAIADYSAPTRSARCWVVFASTTSKVADFASPQAKYNSARVNIGRLLFPPYTELGWDQMATPSNEIPADKNAKLKYIRGFGRPLWTSIGDIGSLELLARLKLAPGIEENKPDIGDQLAVLAQRFGLDIYFGYKEAISLIENAVASHGRVYLATTEERTWSFTTYPSEPLLSCVAAQLLHQSPKARKDILVALNEKVKAGLIEVGKTGELANRLIFLLGKDLYIRQSVQDFPVPLLTPESELFDCKMVPLIGYLQYLFGSSFWGETEANAKALFADAYINFSHWVSMKDDIGKREGMSVQEWIRRLWQRTSAIQCCHGQHMIDAVIPIFFPIHQEFSLCSICEAHSAFQQW